MTKELNDWGYYLIYNADGEHEEERERGIAVALVDLTKYSHLREGTERVKLESYPCPFDYKLLIFNNGHVHYMFHDLEKITESQFETYKEFGVPEAKVVDENEFIGYIHLELIVNEISRDWTGISHSREIKPEWA